MLKKVLNEIKITFHIKATGPILVVQGETEEEKKKRKNQDQDKNAPDMLFIVDANKRIFIPGSSVRGVWRSWCEKIARTISDGMPLACDPFNDNPSDSINLSCSKRLDLKKEKPERVYSQSCPICKLFGNTSQASRIRISDAYIINGDIKQKDLFIRDGIGIDRFTGAASSGAKFRYQYLIGKTFKTEVHIRNFELWQLGLLGYLFRDFEEELVSIGFGKTRGLGKVKGTVEGAVLTFYGLSQPKINVKETEIPGIGSLYTDADKGNYCFAEEKPFMIEIDPSTITKTAIKTTLMLSSNNQAKDLFKKAADYWAATKDDEPQGYFLVAQKLRNEIAGVKRDA